MSRIDGSRKTGEQFLELSNQEPIEIEEVRSPPRRPRRRMGRIAIWLAIFTFLSTFWAGATNWAPTAALMHAERSQELAVAAGRHVGQLVPWLAVLFGHDGHIGCSRIRALSVYDLLSRAQYTAAVYSVSHFFARHLRCGYRHARGRS